VSLICSVRECRAALVRDARRFVCANDHSFDLARSGYLNLLQPQDKRSKTPGDSEQAVAARRRFLDSGATDPLVTSVVATLPLARSASLLDVGCGEGRHLAAFRQAYGIDGCGTDLSIPAIDLAAKRYRGLFWVVANADRFLPWSDDSFDALTSITARLNPEEFHRVLRPDGILLLALPAPDDLIELREAVLGEPQERDRVGRTVESFAPFFTLERHERVAHRALLSSDALTDVMTSSYRGLRPRERVRLEELSQMHVTMARDVLVMRPA
jgi:23S rRNA (guanine745-N1)-methyltransferase